MSRPIEFRGLSDGGWVFGHLYHDQRFIDGQSCCDVLIIRDDADVDHIIKDGTESQFTGLTDKSCIKVFEGDIVIISRQDSLKSIPQKVEYIPACGFVCSREIFTDSWDILSPIYFGHDNLEVIGNIYQNPELLES